MSDDVPTSPLDLGSFPGTAEPERGSAPEGIGMWISWNGPATTQATPEALVAKAVDAGLSWLAVKAGAESESTRWLAHGQELLERARGAGLRLYTWHYSLPASWEHEAEMIARLLASGVDGHVIDAETEWEWAPGVEHFSNVDRRATAAAFMAALRAKVGDDAFVAHAPIWRPQSHERFPYAEFGERCSAVMPQAYWPAAAQSSTSFCARVDDAWRTFHATYPAAAKPLLPIGVTYGAGAGWDNFPGRLTAEDLDAFLDRYPTCSLFSWDAAQPLAWDVLRSRRSPPTAA